MWNNSPQYPKNPADAAYQQAATGTPAPVEYGVPAPSMQKGIKWFDGYDPATNSVIDAKNFTDWPNTDFAPSMNIVQKDLLQEANIAKENGCNLEIRVVTQEKADILQEMVNDNNLSHVKIVYWPK